MTDYFAGVDMSTTRQAARDRTYAACLQKTADGLVLVGLFPLRDDEELQCFLQDWDYRCCGIDAPLSLPPCVRCDPTCRCPFPMWAEQLGEPWESFFHYRLCDLLIRKTIPSLSPKPPLSNGGPVDITPLTLRWHRLSRRLMTHPRRPLSRILEIYASGTLQLLSRRMGLSYIRNFPHRASPQHRALFLENLPQLLPFTCPRHLSPILIDQQDALDALLAALSAFFATHQKSLLPDELLGLTPAPAYVKPLSTAPVEIRQQMADYLHTTRWPRLPDVMSRLSVWKDPQEPSPTDTEPDRQAPPQTREESTWPSPFGGLSFANKIQS